MAFVCQPPFAGVLCLPSAKAVGEVQAGNAVWVTPLPMAGVVAFPVMWVPSEGSTPTTADSPVSSAGGTPDGFASGAQRRKLRRQRARAAVIATTNTTNPEGLDNEENSQDESASAVTQEEQVDWQSAKTLATELLEDLRSGSDETDTQVKVAERFREFAFAHKTSCRAAQVALEIASGEEALTLVSGLHGHVLDALKSIFANYVVQKIVEVLPTTSSSFVAQELSGYGLVTARHWLGCRIICRLLEHGSKSDAHTTRILDEVVDNARALCQHRFGSHALAHFFEFGHPEHKRRIVKALLAELLAAAKTKGGSNVLRVALRLAEAPDRRQLAMALISAGERLWPVAENHFGRHVVKDLLRMPEYKHEVAACLRPGACRLQATKNGRNILTTMAAIRA